MYLVVLLLVSVTASTYRVSAVALINQWLHSVMTTAMVLHHVPLTRGSHDLLDLVSGRIARLGSRFAAVPL